MRSLRSRQAARRRWGIYLLVLVSWAAVVGIFTLLGITICSSLVFQPGFLYALLNFIAEYLLLVVIVSVLAGWVVISYYFIARPETSCQGLFNQIHEKATKKVPEADFSS